MSASTTTPTNNSFSALHTDDDVQPEAAVNDVQPEAAVNTTRAEACDDPTQLPANSFTSSMMHECDATQAAHAAAPPVVNPATTSKDALPTDSFTDSMVQNCDAVQAAYVAAMPTHSAMAEAVAPAAATAAPNTWSEAATNLVRTHVVNITNV